MCACIHLLCCITPRPCLCRPSAPFHAQLPTTLLPTAAQPCYACNPSTPLPLFLLLPSPQLPTAVLSTTARAKARAAKKAKEAGKEPEAAAEAMDTDKPAGEAAAEGAAAAGEGGDDKAEGGEAKKEPEPTSFTGGCMPNTSRAQLGSGCVGVGAEGGEGKTAAQLEPTSFTGGTCATRACGAACPISRVVTALRMYPASKHSLPIWTAP